MDYTPSNTRELPRVAKIDAETLEAEYVSRGIPVVLTDMIRDWPALQRWQDLDYLRQAAGDVEVPVRGNRYHFRLFGTLGLASYLDWLEGKADNQLLDAVRHTAPYISHNRGMTPRLREDTDFSRFVAKGYSVGQPAFWIGPPRAETPLHYDAVGIVYFAQIVGRKRAILFYSHRRNPMLLRERTRQALHWFGIHARGRCSCHSNPSDSEWEACMDAVSNAMAVPAWIDRSPPLRHLARRISHSMLHGHSLGELLDWREPTAEAAQ